MVYSKPQIATLATAVGAIQGLTKMGAVPDFIPPTNRRSISAYEADE
jgi:hypothetical protein